MRIWSAMAVTASLLLCGCGSRAPEPVETQGPVPTSINATPEIPVDNLIALPTTANGASATPERDTSKIEGIAHYSCAGGLAVTVDHDLSWDVMRLTIGARTFELSNMLSDEGNRYRSEIGRAPGKSLMRQTKGDQGMLIEGPKTALPDSAEQKSISCHRTG